MRVESLERSATGHWTRLVRMVAAAAGLCAALVSGAALADAMPVYRFYNNLTGVHFYTISGSERDTVLNNYPQFLYEGAVFWAFNTQEAGTAPVYRFYNTRLGTHFYTQSETEKNYVIANYPVFAFEGAVYYAPPTQDYPGGTGLFRFYNTRTGAHFFTRNPDERDHVLATWPWFAYEGVAYFVLTGPPSGTGGGGNQAPKAILNVSQTAVTTPATVTLTATATDPDGTVAKVQFYNGATMITEVTAAPYTYQYAINAAGTYSFTAVAVDNVGATGASNAVQVVASNGSGGGGGNLAPKITIAASATTITAPGTSVLTATASDDDGTIASVKFYTGGSTLVSTLTAPPYTYTFNGMSGGVTTFTAVATDNAGATTTSNPIAITVNAGGGGGAAVPKLTFSVSNTLVAAPSTVNLTATNVTSTGGPITRVSFYMNGTKLVDKTAAPYTFAASIPNTGTFQFTAEAADAAGGTHMTLPINVQGVNTPPSGPVNADVWRLLQQATFGPTFSEAQRVQSMGISAWIDDQFTQPMSGYPDTKYNRIQLRTTADCATTGPGNVAYPADHPYATCVRDHLSLAMIQRDFFMNAVYAPDQLRQRVAWALSQILVTSGNEPDLSFAHVMSRYQNLMFNNAFGNYETLLQQVTYSPAMGNYLDQGNNDRASGTRVPNENYAREIMQLFSIGLEELNPDGSTINDASGMPVPTYDQNTIKEFAKIFTGLTWADPANPTATTATRKNNVYYALPMIPYPITATSGHETSAKTLLNGTIVPANQTVQQDQFAAVRNVFMHPNTPVYISKQLIQRLVTGNPSPAYVQRISSVFTDNGQGVRGDLKAVVKAILMDPEARGGGSANDPTYGSLKEPVLMITNLIRGLSGVTDGNRLETNASGLGQRPYYPPTVFNYFPPDQTIQGTTVLAPEFLIHTTQTAITRSNLVYNMIYNPGAPDNTIANSTGTRLNTMQFDSLAGNPAALVDQVDLVLTGGQTPASAKATIVTAVNAVPAANANQRSQMATFLLASSYYYQVQH